MRCTVTEQKCTKMTFYQKKVSSTFLLK
eukprot:UN11593